MRQPPQPANPLQAALALHQAGKFDDAERAYRQVRTAQPNLAQAWLLSGVLELQRNRPADAVPHLQRATQLDPRGTQGHLNLGIAYSALGKYNEAQRSLRTCLTFAPRNADLWHRLGSLHQAAGKLSEAAECFHKATDLKPDHVESIDALGALVAETQGMAAALPWFKKATTVNPAYAFGWCNLGIALSHVRQYQEALKALDRAIELQATLAKALTAKGLVMQQLYRLEESAEFFGRGAKADPTDSEAFSGRLLTLHYLDAFTPEQLAAEHRAFGAAMRRALGPPAEPAFTWDGNRPLRVAFVSPDFRRHAVAAFALPLLRHLDPARFTVIACHDHAKTDSVSAEIQSVAAAWRQFAGLNNTVVEKRIRDDQPDILIDLCGHTGVNRLRVFARRVAPIQITYLGYPDTTGLDVMDYRFTDAFCDPVGEADGWHSERLVRFSPVAWAFQPHPESPPPDYQGNPARVVFACYNNYTKVSDTVVALWSRILAGAPSSVLRLKGHDLDDEAFRERVRARFANAGIDTTRLEFHGRTPDTVSHLQAYRDVDISLDPFPYHGTTTTCEALWMGVPVVTLLGRAHVSRVSGSLLTAVGRQEWIAATPDDYVATAVRLASQADLLRAERMKLRAAMATSRLLDHAGQAALFAEALLACARERVK
ncbi:tetratricopeptide repeat protein [Nibricoccus sp. IMCC34717]|uniref:O-linked N-acetylglucosamine transferase, SPINDLY family protein n=1 Tax=Nibricoccus sp. IMCC34717 TaxID=3034021 RepID=UPI00384C665F